MTATARKLSRIEREMRGRGVYEPDVFEAWLQARGWAWQGLDRGDYGVDLEEALILFTFEDPVRWVETYLLEPDSGDPYTYFPYQRASVRSFDQDVVHADAAEVGKTREIVGLLLWTACTGMGGRLLSPNCLVGAPQQIFLDEIIGAIEKQMGTSKGYGGASMLKQFWLEPKRTPHTKLRFLCPNFKHPDKPGLAEIDFRPAGHDGQAFRGVHVNALALVDEAAKMQDRVQWTEFYRAMKPGCRLRVYSVPDGNRNTEFYRLCSVAVPDLPKGRPGFRKFHWPKTLMPPPFWTPERDAEFVKLFGGRDTPGYKRNVLGEWGDAENPVFRWDVILPNVVDLPDYRVLKLAADAANDALYLDASRRELVISEGKKSARIVDLGDLGRELTPFLHGDDDTRRACFEELLAPFLSHIDPRGVFYAGADLGERSDPTEIIVSERVGNELRDLIRLQARGMPYHVQEELLFQLDRALGHRAFWGVDLGSAGTAVVKNLLNLDRYADARFDERLTGFHFQEAVDCIGEDGEPLEQELPDGTREILRAPAKHWSTQCIVARLQHIGYRMAYDDDVLNDMTSHTAREGAKWPIYAKKADHTIDARRMQMLAILKQQSEAGTGPDIFVTSTHARAA